MMFARRGNRAFFNSKVLRNQSTLSSSTTGLTQFGGVHGKVAGTSKMWRNKPLYRREGDKIFKTGAEATQMLIKEAHRRDAGCVEFLESWESMVTSLAGLFDRQPKYAWVMKQLLEPERIITFRVSWIDDSGVTRVNRGFRVQYSSALGPYEGGTTFSAKVSQSYCKAAGFDATFSNALINGIGGGHGGADFNPYTKSETEIQRFCQSYMTELSKYIGPVVDLPGQGSGVTANEIGYLYGQYKRINMHCGQHGKGLLWGGSFPYLDAQGVGVAHFAKIMLEDKGLSLVGKKCVITGSSHVAMALAEKLIEYGAIPLTFTDSSGSIYEPSGFSLANLKTVQKIKNERGARVGRYIIASTSAKFGDPASVFKVPCDLVFSCSYTSQVEEVDVASLASNGCIGIVEGIQQSATNAAIAAAKKKGMLHAPYRATTLGASLFNGLTIGQDPLGPGETLDARVGTLMAGVYQEIKSTAKEFNTRGDLNAGTNIASFIRLADVMVAHGSV